MKSVISRILIPLCICFSITLFAAPIKLTRIQVFPSTRNTRLSFSFSGPFHYHYFMLRKPTRLVIDFDNMSLVAKPSQLSLRGTSIQSIQTGVHPHHALRIVLQLKNPLQIKAYEQPSTHRFGYRLLFNLEKRKGIKRGARHVGRKSPTSIMPLKKPKKLRNAIVIIDPGHGGIDPGATGLRGTHEKNVVLAIGKDLYALLKKQRGIEPKLTRHGDYFVTLRNRLKLARRGHADVFIAIHADAYKNHYARGASVFALSQRGATSEAARWLAQKENYSELGGVNLQDKSYLLRSVLIDLSQTATIRDSLKFGNNVIHSLGKVARLHHGFVEQAPFVVLKSPDIPSLLVETGFISNSREELLLRSSAYQHKIAYALMQGIVSYLHHYPPEGTVLAH